MAFDGPSGRVALADGWTLRSDHFNHGTLKGFQAGAFKGSAITVPKVPNASRVTGAYSRVAFNGTVAWYQTAFTVPSDGLYAIRFESVNHRASASPCRSRRGSTCRPRAVTCSSFAPTTAIRCR